MTNPVQLKYLEAMGIPVWVSRDKVIEQQDVNKALIDDEQQVALNDQNLNIQSDPHSKKNTDKEDSNQSSAKSIIDSLDHSNSNTAVTPVLNEIITESLEKSKVDNASTINNNKVPQDSNLIYKSSDHYIFACGSEQSEWMVIGHSPEPFTGIGIEPFANEAGVLLDNMIRAVGVNNPRQQAYYMNVLNINHSNTTSDIGSSKELIKQLHSQINIVQPKVILIVGQIAAQNLLEIKEPLINMRSIVHKIMDNKVSCVVTYYPSYLLEKPLDKRKAWSDLKLAMSEITDVS